MYVGEVGVSCAIFRFRAPSRRTIVFTCLRLGQVKIYKFGHIMCNFCLHCTTVEFTAGCRKKNLKWHNLPQPWDKLCHSKGQVVSACHVKQSSCKCSESEREVLLMQKYLYFYSSLLKKYTSLQKLRQDWSVGINLILQQ